LKLFPSLSHFIYEKIAQAESEIKAFDVINVRDWILLALSIIVILLTLAVIVLTNKFRKLYSILALSSLAHMAKADLAFKFTTTPVPEFPVSIPPWAQTLANLVPTETLILIAIILIIIVLIGALIAKRQRTAEGCTKTRIGLMVGNSHVQYTISWLEVSFQPELYEVSFKQSRPLKVTLKLRPTCFATCSNELKITNTTLSLRNTRMTLSRQLETTSNISWLMARKIRNLVKQDYFITMTLSDRFGRIHSILQIRQLSGKQPSAFNNKAFIPTAPPSDSELDPEISTIDIE
jgi:hypothetical protein